MKRILLAILALLLCLGASACGEEQPALTLMVYLCGSDLETSAGAATADLEEMMVHYPTDGSVRVLVMASGAKKWHSDISAGENAIYELRGDGLTKVHALPLASMGTSEPLTALLDYGYASAPAQRHALILWNHGAGPLLGVCFDEQFSDGAGMDGLTLEELSAALAASPAAENPLSWIGFDACLMASVETACTVAPYAEYMVASQDTEPASGWSYAFLEAAGQDENGAQTGRRIIDAYFASLADTLAPVTLSCVNLSVMEAVGEEMDTLFDSLHLTLDDRSYPDFAACRVNTKSVGCATAYEYDLVDLVDLLEVYRAEGMAGCDALLALLDQAIVESRSNTEYINGLNIHYPHYGAEAETPPALSEGYSAFVADMSAIRLGEPLTDWSSQHHLESAREDGVTLVTLALTSEQAAHLDSARLYIFKEMGAQDYQLVYQTDDVTLTEEGILQATYEEQALYLVDGEGNVISESLPYSLIEDGLVLRCTLNKDDISADKWVIAARMIFRRDAQGRYRLSEILEITDDPALQGKVTVDLNDYDTLMVGAGSSIPTYDESGKLLPPAQWKKGDLIHGWEMRLEDHPVWSVDFRSQQDGNSRAAVLQITDTQNNTVCSDLLSIENPNIEQLPVARQLLLECDYCRIYLNSVQKVKGNFPQLRLRMECENLHSEMITVDVRYLQLGDTILSTYSGGSPAVHVGQTQAFQVEVDSSVLEALRLQQADRMEMSLLVVEGYLDDLLEQRAVVEAELDLRDIAPEPAAWETAATALWDGVEMTLYNLNIEDQSLTGRMAMRNTTQEHKQFEDEYVVYLDDVYTSGTSSSGSMQIRLPPGTVIHTDVKVNLAKEALHATRPYLHGLMLEELGLTTLEEISFNYSYDFFGEDYRVDFRLAEPLALPLKADVCRMDDWHLLYEKDGVSVWLVDITWEPEDDTRHVNICLRNENEGTVEFYIPPFAWPEYGVALECSVNGIELDYLSTPMEISPRCTVLDSVDYEAKEGCRDMQQMVLTFTMQDDLGRSDKVRAVITPVAGPQETEKYLVYEAEQLRVEASIQ